MQSRQQTRATIVEVAADLLRSQGAAAVTIRAVAQAAGLQAPTLYRFFDDKDTLLDAVAEHVFAAYVSTKSESADTGDPVDDLRAAWHTHIGFGLTNGALYALLTDRARTHPSPAAEQGVAVLRARVHRVAAAGRLRVPETRAVELIHAAGTGTVLTLLAAPADDRDPTLADDMLDALLRTILTDATAPLSTDATTTVLTLPTLTPAERTLLTEWLSRT
jgi:AcrR family transcriptional regulator